MSKLDAFLNPISQEETKEVVISKRFVDEKGNPVPFKIKTITQEKNDALIKNATSRKKVGQNQYQEVIDNTRYRGNLLLSCVVEPDFNTEEMRKRYGSEDPVEIPRKMLLTGEYANLLKAIMDLNGFNQDPDEMLDEAKK